MKIKVLLVDDEKDFVVYTAKRLRARGMDVQVTHDAESALQRVQDQPFDIVVLDLLMPGMDGMAALRALKQLRADLPVIMLSGHGNKEAAEEGKKHGAVAYLLKPCDFKVLHETIAQLASTASQGTREK